jgi:hypothetical protein
MLTRKNEVKFELCAIDDNKVDEMGECEKKANSATAVQTSGVRLNKHKMKRYYIVQTITRKDGTKSVLTISQHGEEDSGEDFVGTLTVESDEAAWARSGEIKVNCQVTTP